MSRLNSTYKILSKFRIFLENYEPSQFWVYSKYKEFGSLLVKNTGNDERSLFKPWDTDLPIGTNKLKKFIESNKKYKGHFVDKYIIIGKKFRDNSKRFSRVEKNLTLVEVNFIEKEIILFFSNNIDHLLLNSVIEFSDYVKYKISYDFQGVLKHSGFKKNGEQITEVESTRTNPSVFLSYSWDNEAHKLWVLKLASELMRNGINVLIDEWDLRKYKNDLQFFMESGIRESDYVIMVCTSMYAHKVNKRQGGVGIENTIITGEFFDENRSEKFIPIVRQYSKDLRDSLPSYLKTRYAIDFSIDTNFDKRIDELIRMIFNVPKYKKPKLGKIPNLNSKNI